MNLEEIDKYIKWKDRWSKKAYCTKIVLQRLPKSFSFILTITSPLLKRVGEMGVHKLAFQQIC